MRGKGIRALILLAVAAVATAASVRGQVDQAKHAIDALADVGGDFVVERHGKETWIIAADFTGNKSVGGEELKIIAKVAPRATKVYLGGTSISDEDITTLANLHDLEYLELAGTKLRGTTFEALGSLKSLRYLGLGRSACHEQYSKLKSLTSLRVLDLSEAVLADEETRFIAVLALREVSLVSTSVGDLTARHLKTSKTLEVIDLSFTKVTDAGLREISNISTLRALNLSFCLLSRIRG